MQIEGNSWNKLKEAASMLGHRRSIIAHITLRDLRVFIKTIAWHQTTPTFCTNWVIAVAEIKLKHILG